VRTSALPALVAFAGGGEDTFSGGGFAARTPSEPSPFAADIEGTCRRSWAAEHAQHAVQA